MDLYQNNGMDKNRIYIKELYLYDIDSDSPDGTSATHDHC